jgi:amino acid adenylation domain-containing protein
MHHPVNISLLEKSINTVIARHEALRTVFNHKTTKRPIQIVLKRRHAKVYYEDITSMDQTLKQSHIQRYKHMQKERGFDLSRDLLINLAVFRTDSEIHHLIFSFHHIIMDGWCLGIILKELFQVYKSLEDSQLAALKTVYSYGNYIVWLQKQDRKAARKYWKKYLNGYQQQASLPKTKTLPGTGEYEYNDLFFKLDESLTTSLASVAKKNSVTLNSMFQVIWGILLKHYCGVNDVVFGAVVSGRPYEVMGAEKMIGLFINTIPVRITFDENKAFCQLIRDTQAASLESEKYHYFPLAQIQADTELRQGLLDHIMIFENYPVEKEISGSVGNEGLFGYRMSNIDVFEQTNYDFNIIIMPGSEIAVKLSYNELVYSREFITKIEGHLKEIIKTIIKNPEVCINDISILTQEEKKQILNDFNATATEYEKDRTIHQLFEKQAEIIGDEIAVVCGNETLTYAQLNRRANQLARTLIEKGVKPDSIVGIMTARSVDMMVGIMGVLKAGGAYLPIDPDYPTDRIKFMLEDSKAEILLTQKAIEREKRSGTGTENPSPNEVLCPHTLYLDDEHVYASDGANPVPVNEPGNLVYVIYTSGSTGKPKGVMIEHRNVANFIKGMTEKIDFSHGKTILCLTTISFDIFVLESLLPLAMGLKIVIANETEQIDPHALNDVIIKNRVHIIQTTPSRMKLLIDSGDLRCLKQLTEILAGGEILPEALRKQLSSLSDAKIYNMYGPTETTVWSTLKEVTGDMDLNIGKPIANTRIYIVDKHNRLQPVGVPGELCICGDGLARGYLNRSELTAEKFIADPYNNTQRMYRTGDLARWLPDGNIEFIGRMDNQVKVRGYRIELGEIETRLVKYDTIQEAVVMVGDGKNGVPYLCAYIVCDQPVDAADIRAYLAKYLPNYMIPSFFIQIDTIPLTPNGKTDRKALPEPSWDNNATEEYVQPRTALERELVQIWSEVLGVDRIGIKHNFFHLGGHSIYMMQVIAKIANRLGIDVSIAEFFSHSTIEELASLISDTKAERAGNAVYPYREPEPERIHEPFPLTDIQMAYLMGRDEKFEMGGISTHMYMEVETELDMNRFNRAINKLIERHPMLRAIVLPTGQQQILESVPEYKIQVQSLVGMNVEERQTRLEQDRQRMSHHIFRTDQWPLFEIKAYQVENNKTRLHIGLDMLIADAGSMQIIPGEILQYYQEMDAKLPELKFTFRDYMMAYTAFKTSQKYLKDKEYWMSKIEDFPNAPALPMKTDPARVTKPHFNRLRKTVDRQKWERLKKKAREYKITPSALLCAAYAQVLSFWSNQQRLALNLTVFSRYPFHEDVGAIIGDFTSVLLLDLAIETSTFSWQSAADVQTKFMDALEHRHYDGVQLIRELSRRRGFGNRAVMPVVFTSMLVESKQVDEQTLGQLKTAVIQTSQVYIDHQASEDNSGLVLVFDYVQELFDESMIRTMFEQYIWLLDSLLEGSDAIIGVSEEDRRVIEQYNDTAEDIPASTLTALFKEQVRRVPEHVAVICKDHSITYRELDERSARVASYLKARKAGKNEAVAVLAKRSIETIVNIMGILKAGAAYVPIDPEYPEDRRKAIIENSGCRFVLDGEIQPVNIPQQNDTNHKGMMNHPEDTAYVIYTSGSTGRPKGVVISHRAVSNTIIDINRKFNVNEKDRIIALSSMCFDLSVYDIFGALSSGAAMVMVEDRRDIFEIMNTIQDHQITIWNSVPAIMDMVVENADKSFINSSLRLVMLSGDWIPIGLPDKVRLHFTDASVISLGGATEASIWSIYYPIDEIKEGWKSIPYGMPLANQRFYVLNYEMQLCPIGVTGELFIGGTGVAEGYMNDEEKTKAAFVTHPQFGRLYRTGDYGALRIDSERQQVYIEFQGRKDHQIKIRGHRIELGEIETCLLKHDFISNAVVADKIDARGKQVLCAYYIADEELTAEELKTFLARHLPEYMIPSFYIEMDEMPLTPNGKIDRKKLPVPELCNINTYEPPTNPVEEKLCRIWEEILKVERAGINDSFFDLGGNSLTAVQLITKVRKDFNINIPLREVLGLSNIKEIAKYMIEQRNPGEYKHDDNLILLKKGLTTDKHLFIVHAGSGEAEGYMGLCDKLGGGFNCWGIRADRLRNYTPENLTIEDIASKYIEKVKTIQPKGPYHIAGWCVGGTTAFEMVRQFEQSGEQVKFFALINSYAPQKGFYEYMEAFSTETEKALVEQFLKDNDMNGKIQMQGLTDIDTIWPFLITYAHDHHLEQDILSMAREKIPQNIASIIPDYNHINLEGLVYYMNVIRIYAAARAKYIPSGKVNTRIHFFEAKKSRISNKENWKMYCNEDIDYDEVNGTHFSIFDPENVQELAKKIGNKLE